MRRYYVADHAKCDGRPPGRGGVTIAERKRWLADNDRMAATLKRFCRFLKAA